MVFQFVFGTLMFVESKLIEIRFREIVQRNACLQSIPIEIPIPTVNIHNYRTNI